MSDLIEIISSNTPYIITTACMFGITIFFAVKKMIKFLIIALIALVVFLSYVYYTGQTVEDTVDEVEDVVK
jgi:hypothetical protein